MKDIRYFFLLLVLSAASEYIITTFAGNGSPNFGGDGGPATSASFSTPRDVAVANNKLFITDMNNNLVRAVDLISNIITTIAGNGSSVFGGDGGIATLAGLPSPIGLTVENNTLFISDTHRIRAVDLLSNIISTFAGNGVATFAGDGGPATSASINYPYGLTVANNKLFIADLNNNRVRAVELSSNTISTFAGNGNPTFAGDGGLATSASINLAKDVTVGNNMLFIADSTNHRIRAVDLISNIITTVAGTGSATFGGDGAVATSASLNAPRGVFFAFNKLFIADAGNNRIRTVDLSSNIITTFAGNGNAASSGDGGDATSASINFPYSVTVAMNKVFIAESNSHLIRVVDLSVNGVNGQRCYCDVLCNSTVQDPNRIQKVVNRVYSPFASPSSCPSTCSSLMTSPSFSGAAADWCQWLEGSSSVPSFSYNFNSGGSSSCLCSLQCQTSFIEWHYAAAAPLPSASSCQALCSNSTLWSPDSWSSNTLICSQLGRLNGGQSSFSNGFMIPVIETRG